MTVQMLTVQARDAFNRHGKFTARTILDVFMHDAVEIRYADTGHHAATVWPPVSASRPHWRWLAAGAAGAASLGGVRYLPETTTVEALVRAVATHVLDEVTKR